MRRLQLHLLLPGLLALAGCEESPEPLDVVVPRVVPVAPVVRPEGPLKLRCTPGASFDPGPALARRLNRLEYDNTVRDLLGDATSPARSGFVADERSLGYDNNAGALQASTLHVEQYMEAAEILATEAVKLLDAWLPEDCDEQVDCARQLLGTFGLRAWRRPLEPTELDQLLTVFEVGRASATELAPFESGISLMFQALLQSPHFLYRIEVGTPDPAQPGLVRLTDYEIASRLSYLLWRSMPDDTLLAAAAAGELSDPELIAAQTERMMADPRAKDALWDFVSQWLGINELDTVAKDARLFPQFDAQLRQSMALETRLFVESILETGDMRRLFDADYTFIDSRLAEIYDVPPPDTGGVFERRQLGPERGGILTQPSLMTVYAQPNISSPILRGIFTREKLLCHPIPTPPPQFAAVPPDPDPSLTGRELFRLHTQSPACAGCHTLIDPIGFGYESFDSIGRYRTMDNGQPVDSRGELTATFAMDGPFDGAAELGALMSDSRQVHECLTVQMFRFAFGRGEQMDVDGCTLTELYAGYEASGFNLVRLMQQITRSDAFRYRRAEPKVAQNAAQNAAPEVE